MKTAKIKTSEVKKYKSNQGRKKTGAESADRGLWREAWRMAESGNARHPRFNRGTASSTKYIEGWVGRVG